MWPGHRRKLVGWDLSSACYNKSCTRTSECGEIEVRMYVDTCGSCCAPVLDRYKNSLDKYIGVLYIFQRFIEMVSASLDSHNVFLPFDARFTFWCNWK